MEQLPFLAVSVGGSWCLMRTGEISGHMLEVSTCPRFLWLCCDLKVGFKDRFCNLFRFKYAISQTLLLTWTLSENASHLCSAGSMELVLQTMHLREKCVLFFSLRELHYSVKSWTTFIWLFQPQEVHCMSLEGHCIALFWKIKISFWSS